MSEYRTEWFEARKEGARESARVVLPLLFDLIEPSSVVDLGCGTGSWLSVARDLGIVDFLGLDAPHLDTTSLEIPVENFLIHDLETPLELDREFDLALCLEVGEHIASEAAESLTDTLTRLAPVVLFSAAIPGQGGTAHVNEQWPDFWAALFRRRGYRSYDLLRSRLWSDARVRYFYAQNTILYVRERDVHRFPRLPDPDSGHAPPLCIVHPRLFERTRYAFPPADHVTLKSLAYFSGRLLRRLFEGCRRALFQRAK